MFRDEVLELFERAAADREHGAAEIERTLVNGLLAIGGRLRLDSLHQGLRMLADGQPAMANLRSMARWMAAVESPASCRARLQRRAAVLEDLAGRLAANAWPFLSPLGRVVTISRSSAVAQVVEGARARGWSGSAVVLDGTASGRGADQAQRLRKGGEALSVRDDEASKWLGDDSVLVLVGADAVGSRRFVNSSGTLGLLETARRHGVDTVLVADSGKDVAEDVVDEIVALSPRHKAPSGEEWPIFEAVPLELVTARVTE